MISILENYCAIMEMQVIIPTWWSPDRVDQTITFVNLWDAYRFVNWLQNGQP